MSAVTILHNPSCGTSRKVLALLRERGAEPVVVEYLKTPPTPDRLADLIRRAGLTPREALRRKGTPAAELGLDDPSVDDDRLLAAMVAQPILIERPIVETPLGVRLCRPPERVLEILPEG